MVDAIKVLPVNVENWVGFPEAVPGGNPLIEETVREEIAAVLPVTPMMLEKTMVLVVKVEFTVSELVISPIALIVDPTKVE